jgi:predicted DNA-binding ribbon-helix-helix protein
VKHSFTIAGHRTSISLEQVFWTELKAAAAAERRSVASLVRDIDEGRGDAGLSSAVRVWVLDYVRTHAIASPPHPSRKALRRERDARA